MERRNMSRNHEGARTSERRGREATGASTLARSRVTRASSSTSTNSTRRSALVRLLQAQIWKQPQEPRGGQKTSTRSPPRTNPTRRNTPSVRTTIAAGATQKESQGSNEQQRHERTKERTGTHLVAVSSSRTASSICTAVCSMLYSTLSSSVPWSMTSADRSLNSSASCAMLFAISVSSRSRVCRLESTVSTWRSTAPTLDCSCRSSSIQTQTPNAKHRHRHRKKTHVSDRPLHETQNTKAKTRPLRQKRRRAAGGGAKA